MAHRRQKTRFRQIGFFSAATRFIRKRRDARHLRFQFIVFFARKPVFNNQASQPIRKANEKNMRQRQQHQQRRLRQMVPNLHHAIHRHHIHRANHGH